MRRIALVLALQGRRGRQPRARGRRAFLGLVAGLGSHLRLADEPSRQPSRRDRPGPVGGANSTWHRQVLPGLTLKCFAKKTGATCQVTDAGQPVAGATIKIGRQSVKTLNSGVDSFALRKGTYTAAASKAGYTSASARVRVR